MCQYAYETIRQYANEPIKVGGVVVEKQCFASNPGIEFCNLLMLQNVIVKR